MNSPFFTDNSDFQMWGTQHFVVLLTTLIFGILLINYALRRLKPEQQYRLGLNLSFFIAFVEVAWMLVRLYLGVFDAAEDLPFVICHFMALILPILMFTLHRGVYEVLYFWILSGTLQAILTPHLINGFPHYTFWMFWIVHCGLVVMILYATIVYKMRPTFKSIGKAFAVLQVYIVLSFLINYLLGANYNYVCQKPPTASLLDYLGSWPWYVIGGDLVVLLLFILVYLPFGIMDKWKLVMGSEVTEAS